MDLKTRLTRRKRDTASGTLVRDPEALSPVAHLADPVGREVVVERLLDHIDPAFDGDLPPNGYLWGPPGAGKSAVVTALASGFEAWTDTVVYADARDPAGSDGRMTFGYVDARTTNTECGLYAAVLSALGDENVPDGGVKAAHLRDRIRSRLEGRSRRALVAVDHVGEPETPSLSRVSAALGDVHPSLSWLAVGRTAPADLSGAPAACIEVSPYRRTALSNLLLTRATEGLAPGAIDRGQTDDVAAWADGDAHDALAVLYCAADHAATRGASRIERVDLTAGFEAVPQPCVSLGRTLSQASNRQRVLATLIETAESERTSVATAAEAIAADGVDLSPSTIQRYLYELAEHGVLDRLRAPAGDVGRPPSAVAPRFPTPLFRRLSDQVP